MRGESDERSDVNAVVGGLACVWLGMVLAISFLEAPLRFRAPGITLALGLSIGRVVFAALNRAEVALLVVMGVAMAVGPSSAGLLAVGAVVAVVLGVQLALVRPRLVRRSNRVLAGEDAPRSRSHHGYVALEVIKVLGLLALAWTALR
jgi:hypothetical protein